ncbi:hypothetical protein [Streptosporangium roseum]|uniref:hypothetical protein n=1 Tax=Streptosporangium roseum TaxID=2001 RepID=UPI00331880D5
MIPPQAPAWVAENPYPGAPDGSHWDGCERTHPRCAYLLGVAHGRIHPTPVGDPIGYAAAEAREHAEEAEDRRTLHGAACDELTVHDGGGAQ